MQDTGGNKDVRRAAKEYLEERIQICREDSADHVDKCTRKRIGSTQEEDQQYLNDLTNERRAEEERLRRLQSKD